MLKRSITYKNHDDQEVTETFAFNLTKAEVVELEMSVPGGFSAWGQRLEGSRDGKEIIAFLKSLFRASYGEITPANKFIKTSDTFDSFVTTEAYSELFMKIATNPEEFAAFVNGVMPKDLVEEAKRIEAQGNAGVPGPSPKTVVRVLTQAEQRELGPEELRRGLVSGEYQI